MRCLLATGQNTLVCVCCVEPPEPDRDSDPSPLTWVMSQAMAGTALQLGWLLEGAALLVGFGWLCRIMELLNVRRYLPVTKEKNI